VLLLLLLLYLRLDLLLPGEKRLLIRDPMAKSHRGTSLGNIISPNQDQGRSLPAFGVAPSQGKSHNMVMQREFVVVVQQ